MVKKSYKLNFVAYFFLISLLCVNFFSFILYINLRHQQIGPTFQALEQVADEKIKQIDQWFNSLKARITIDINNQEILDSANIVITNRIKTKPDYQEAYQYLKQYFEQSDQQIGNISILSNSGIVIFSTDSHREGQYQPLQNTTTYFTLNEIDSITPNFYQSSTDNQPMITFGLPLIGPEQKRIGVLAIDLNLTDLDRLIRSPMNHFEKNLSFKQSATESYLVGKVSAIDNVFVGNSLGEPTNIFNDNARLTNSIDSRGITRALGSESGADMYLNYNQNPVLGVYRWIPNYRFGLIVEIAQSQVFGEARRYTTKVFVGGLTIVAVICTIYIILAKYA